jgi:hypothetical protein
LRPSLIAAKAQDGRPTERGDPCIWATAGDGNSQDRPASARPEEERGQALQPNPLIGLVAGEGLSAAPRAALPAQGSPGAADGTLAVPYGLQTQPGSGRLAR